MTVPERQTSDARLSRLHSEFRPAAERMLRRAFGGAFDHATVEDIYSSAWVGALRALRSRVDDMDDDELRSYMLAAVANHASKELRRRGRKPTAPLESAPTPKDDSGRPDERAESAETTRIARDLLSSMPERRRAVILLRYGWGLDPKEVCSLVDGLSPRAYRKEITRGIADLTTKLGLVERGEWCRERRPVLEALAAGLADGEAKLQAQHHVAHCRGCAELVSRLSGQLHELAAAPAVALVSGAVGERELGLAELADRGRESLAGVLSRGGEASADAAAAVAGSGGTRGAGAVGTGIAAKLAGLGMAGKAALACVGTGAAATACVAAGVVSAPALPGAAGTVEPIDETVTEQVVGDVIPTATELTVAPGPSGPVDEVAGSTEPEEPVAAPPGSPAPSAPPDQQQFGLPGAAAATPSASGGAGSGGGGPPVQQEFGP